MGAAFGAQARPTPDPPPVPPPVPPPEEESSDEGSEICNQLDLLESGDQSDVTLICGEQRFLVHTHILSARSDVFRAIFCTLEEDRTAHLSDIGSMALKNMLHYCYSGEVPSVSLEDALKVYEAANLYAIETLRKKCRSMIKKGIVRENDACIILVFASEREANDLEDIAISYLATRKSYLLSENWRKFQEKYPKLAIEVFLAFVRRVS